MGQSHSAKEDQSENLDNVKIRFEDHTFNVSSISRSTTVSHLIAILNTNYSRLRFPIISVKTANSNEILDCWLSMPERTLTPLRNNEELFPVFYSPVPAKVGIKTFEVIKIIGRGTYAVVTQVRKKDTGIIYAMKSIDKEKIRKHSLIPHLKTEKEILSTIKSNFIARMHWAFQTEHRVHFILDFYPGGEFFYHLRKIRQFTEDQARFYFSEILLGIKALHKKEIGYRDLKPENIVIDIDGHIRLTDFGLAKENFLENSMSFCGSPDYMSPEMLENNGHSKMVDYYCLGALLHEMLTEFPPFYDRNIAKMYENIRSKALVLPKHISHEAQSILHALLDKNPETRLGHAGIQEIMQHPWCTDIPWKQIKLKSLIPPFLPSLRNSNFDENLTKVVIEGDFLSDTELSFDEHFSDFDYNLITQNDFISKQYFERSNKRSSSHKREKLANNSARDKSKKLIDISLENSPRSLPFSTQISPLISPLNSLNSSYISSEPFSLHEYASKKPRASLNGNRLTVPKPDFRNILRGKTSIIEIKEETSIGTTLKNSLFTLISKFKE